MLKQLKIMWNWRLLDRMLASEIIFILMKIYSLLLSFGTLLSIRHLYHIIKISFFLRSHCLLNIARGVCKSPHDAKWVVVSSIFKAVSQQHYHQTIKTITSSHYHHHHSKTIATTTPSLLVYNHYHDNIWSEHHHHYYNNTITTTSPW